MKCRLFLIVLFCWPLAAAGQQAAEDAHDHEEMQAYKSDTERLERVKDVAREFVTPCCWSETVDLHRSDSAEHMRADIDDMLSKGQTKAQIKAAMVEEYGERILAKPKMEGFNYLAIITPILVLLFGTFLAVLFVRSRSYKDEPAAVGTDPELLSQLDSELKEMEE